MANYVNVRNKLSDLMSRRDTLEAEIINLHSELKKQNVGMSEPVVDAEGYPRNDIDVYTVRHLRQQIICKQNDCKALTKEIEENLHILHAEEKVGPNQAHQNGKPENPQPFAKVDLVDNNSPAQKADLRVGDLIIKFAALTACNFSNLSSLSSIVANNVQKPIRVNVVRENKVVPLILIPQPWEGDGHLGCRIIPLRK